MGIRELGTCGVVVIGGAVYGISQGGLGDALNEDLRAYYEVSDADRGAYMESIVLQFEEAFDAYLIETENYIFVGHSEFSATPAQGVFEEVVGHPEEDVPREALAEIKSRLNPETFCAQDEMRMVTEKGWNYRFKLKDQNGKLIGTVICNAQQNLGTA